MNAAIIWATNNNITKIQLLVCTENTVAIHLYIKLGFCIEGLITRAIRVNKIYFDHYIMGLHI